MTIGAIILYRRKELGMTQKQLAEKLNITDRTVSRWECGVNLPDVEMLKTISKILNVDINYFYEDVKVNKINQVEEYDYDKIKKFKMDLIIPFVILIFSIIMLAIIKYVIINMTSVLGLIPNIDNYINYIYSADILNKIPVLMIFILIGFILILISLVFYLKAAIAFNCFYREKLYQTAYIDVYKKTKIIYYILVIISIILLII